MTSSVLGPALLSGLIALGLASLLLVLVSILRPSVFSRLTSWGSSASFTANLSTQQRMRDAHDKRRRAQALAALAKLKNDSRSTTTVAFEQRTALAARKELLVLVGAPRYSILLLPAVGKEAAVTVLRKLGVITNRSESLRGRPRDEVLELAAAWIRIAEIETSIGKQSALVQFWLPHWLTSNISFR